MYRSYFQNYAETEQRTKIASKFSNTHVKKVLPSHHFNILQVFMCPLITGLLFKIKSQMLMVEEKIYILLLFSDKIPNTSAVPCEGFSTLVPNRKIMGISFDHDRLSLGQRTHPEIAIP